MDVFMVVLVGVLGYLLGSANASLIVGKFYGVDVRQHGSGNAGATNTLRTLGKKAAALVAIGDILKGVIACVLGFYIVGDIGTIIAGTASVIGHNWPVFFGFKGGKGIFTSFAVILMMDWKIGLMLFGIFIIVVVISKYISLGSILGSALFPVAAVIFKKTPEFIICAAILGILAVVRHSSNIKRIFDGTESKFSLKKKK